MDASRFSHAPRVELLLDLLARLVKEVGLELLRRAESVLVCVKRIEGRLVDRHLLAGALLEAECAEATSELGDRQLAVAILRTIQRGEL